MLLANFPTTEQAAPPSRTRTRGRIVWQDRYEGVATVAYQGGKAIAGISGPWSDRYVLTWWDQPHSENQIELFETLAEAKEAVLLRVSDDSLPVIEPKAAPRGMSWLRALFGLSSRCEDVVDRLRRQRTEETDLTGLNFGASR